MEMSHLKRFEDFERPWDPANLRKDNIPENMPPEKDFKDYCHEVFNQIKKFLKETYKFSINQIKEIIKKIKNEYYSYIKHILEDSAINWDTPNICAQKIIKELEEDLFSKDLED